MTYDPAVKSGKRFWVRGKDLGAAASTISTWTDNSGLGNNATRVGSTNLPVVAGSSTPAGGKACQFKGPQSYFLLPALGGVVASASSSYPPSGPDGGADRAIDGQTNTYWTTNGVAAAWIQFRYFNAFASTQYTIRRRDDIPNRNPKDWTFEGSNNGSSWTVLDTRTGITWPTSGEVKTFSFSNTTAYLYYRVNITANGGDTYTCINEFTQNNVPAGAAEAWVVLKSTGTGKGLWNMGGYTSASDAEFYPFSDGLIYENFGLVSGQRQNWTPSMSITSGYRLYRIRNDGTTWQAWIDQTSQKTASGKAVGWYPTPTLGLNGFGSDNTDLLVAECLITDTLFTTDEVGWMIDYVNTEHGLSVPGGVAPPSGYTGWGIPISA